jgi:hypothetical protein
MPAFDLSLGLGVIGSTTDVLQSRYVRTRETSSLISISEREGVFNDQRSTRDPSQASYSLHAEKTGSVSKTCRYFGIGRASFYRWRHIYRERGEAGLQSAQRSVTVGHDRS